MCGNKTYTVELQVRDEHGNLSNIDKETVSIFVPSILGFAVEYDNKLQFNFDRSYSSSNLTFDYDFTLSVNGGANQLISFTGLESTALSQTWTLLTGTISISGTYKKPLLTINQTGSYNFTVTITAKDSSLINEFEPIIITKTIVV